MSDSIAKTRKNIEISLGLLVGYFIAGLLNMYFFDKSWKEAFSDNRLLMGVAGIALSLFIYQKLVGKERTKQLPK